MKNIVLLSLIYYTSTSFSQQWLYITEHSAGFKYDENQKKLRSTRFTVEDDKFVIDKE